MGAGKTQEPAATNGGRRTSVPRRYPTEGRTDNGDDASRNTRPEDAGRPRGGVDRTLDSLGRLSEQAWRNLQPAYLERLYAAQDELTEAERIAAGCEPRRRR